MIDCNVYVACKMTGRDKVDMVRRASYVCILLKKYGLTPIHPVIEEHIVPTQGPLVNRDQDKLRGFWKRDKWLIRNKAHVVLIDGANQKSFGVEREYGLNRWCLWKPTVLLIPDPAMSVADFEDDYIAVSLSDAAEFIRENFGTRRKRWKWRVKMLMRSLPGWISSQILAWR